MDIEGFRNHCLKKVAVTEELPFGPQTLVMKVAGKMFALTSFDDPDFRLNLKCEPQRAEQLRDRHPEIVGGYHMNKKHWNTLYVDRGTLSDTLLIELIDHSYELVVAGLSKKIRAEFGLL